MEVVILILSILFTGLVVGALGRLAIPGPNPMGIGMTILLGVAGALLGVLVAALIGVEGWLVFTLEVAAAALLVWLVSRGRTRRQSGPAV